MGVPLNIDYSFEIQTQLTVYGKEQIKCYGESEI